MDWISFLWGVGSLFVVNIVLSVLVLPKQLKYIAELEKGVIRVESFMSEYEEKMASVNKARDEMTLAVERLKSSIKLRKICPACGHEFPLYFVEEKVNG